MAAAYRSAGKNDDAISAYESYLNLKKDDPAALLGGLGLLETRAYYNSQNAQAYQAAAQFYGSSVDDGALSALRPPA